MSKYTTEIRFICEELSGLDESKGYNNIDEIISKAIPKIFSFYYPIFSSDYKSVLEKKILRHFYTREIGEETYALWKLRLEAKLNEIMPYYNKLYESELLEFNPMYDEDITTTRSTKGNVDSSTEENLNDTSKANSESTLDFNSKTTDNVTTHDESTSTATGVNMDAYSDTPQGSLAGVSELMYLTNARKVDSSDSGSGMSNGTRIGNNERNDKRKVNAEDEREYERERKGTGNVKSVEDFIETVKGRNVNGSELLEKFRKTFLNIDMMIINDLDVLFMQLW